MLSVIKIIETGPRSNLFQMTRGGMDDINALVVHMRRDFKMGLIEENLWNLNLDSLPYSQAGVVRHKSPHAGYALGYLHGVHKSYNQ